MILKPSIKKLLEFRYKIKKNYILETPSIKKLSLLR